MSKIKPKDNLPHIEVKISKDGRDFSNDPTFIKKKQQATAFLKKAGWPKDWENRMK